MRGTHACRFGRMRGTGIIPAYAGNTRRLSSCQKCNRDHPRVCGEHGRYPMARRIGLGSSPRMRGTHGQHFNQFHVLGIIPAYAGNTRSALAWHTSMRDHPRVCGEHLFEDRKRILERGSSPRMRGTLKRVHACGGLRGIIPAYAGNTVLTTRNTRSRRDHPRVCGEHSTDEIEKAASMGSSPRMRGTLPQRHLPHGGIGIITAYAGNTPTTTSAAWWYWDHPRVCGEH